MIDWALIWYYLEPFVIMIGCGLFAMLLGLFKEIYHLHKLPESVSAWREIYRKISIYFQVGFAHAFGVWVAMGLFQFSFLEGDNVIILGGILLALSSEILPRELWTLIWHYLAPLWDYFTGSDDEEREKLKIERRKKKVQAKLQKKLEMLQKMQKEKELIQQEITKIQSS